MIRRFFDGLHRFEIALVVIVVCLAAVGIGRAFWPDADQDGGPVAGSPAPVEKLPVVVDAAEPGLVDGHSSRAELGLPPDAPGSDDTLTARVLDEIQQKTLVMAGLRAEVTAACEGGEVAQKRGQKTLCTVTYQGVKLTWDVWITNLGGDAVVRFYDYDVYPPDASVLLARAVYGGFWDLHHKTAQEMRCDRIPPHAMATLDEDTGYDCQYLEADTDGDAPRWVNEKVVLGSAGPSFRGPLR